MIKLTQVGLNSPLASRNYVGLPRSEYSRWSCGFNEDPFGLWLVRLNEGGGILPLNSDSNVFYFDGADWWIDWQNAGKHYRDDVLDLLNYVLSILLKA